MDVIEQVRIICYKLTILEVLCWRAALWAVDHLCKYQVCLLTAIHACAGQARSFYSLPRAVWQHHLRQASHRSALECVLLPFIFSSIVHCCKEMSMQLLACCKGKLSVMSRLLTSAGVLQMLQHTQVGHVIQFQKYDQSAQCQSIRESSVSYAAAVMTIV